jgi:hypothetical protein
MKKINSFEGGADVKINTNLKAHPNPAPQKMAIAMAIFEEHNAAQKNKSSKKNGFPKLSMLQKELLNFYAQEPSEMQMQQVKAFLSQLLKEENYTSEMSAESKIAA